MSAPGTEGNPIKVGLSPLQMVFTPDGKMAYVANYASASVTPIRLADGRAEPRIAGSDAEGSPQGRPGCGGTRAGPQWRVLLVVVDLKVVVEAGGQSGPGA
jgi:hypothetical protein